MIGKVRIFFELAWKAVMKFIHDDALNHGAALSYYTVFALPPILIILISAIGFFWGEAETEGYLFAEMGQLVGESGAEQIRMMLDKVAKDGSKTATIVGVITLLFSSTVVFYTIQHSLNRFWEINEKVRHGFIKYVLDKFLSLAFLFSFGFLLMVSLVMQTIISGVSKVFGGVVDDSFTFLNDTPIIGEGVQAIYGLYTIYLSNGMFFLLEFVVALLINGFMFTCLFKFLPDARVKWRVAWGGGLLTAFLFDIGQFAIGWHLGHTDFGNSYGPAGAIIVVFVWIFYSSQLILYGGIFTFLLGKRIGMPIEAVEAKGH